MGRNIENGWLVQVRDEPKEYLVISLGDEERSQSFGYERESVAFWLTTARRREAAQTRWWPRKLYWV
jgi:hypothetical protein